MMTLYGCWLLIILLLRSLESHLIMHFVDFSVHGYCYDLFKCAILCYPVYTYACSYFLQKSLKTFNGVPGHL